MAELREVLGGLGLGAVQTYVQSGNEVFDGEGAPEALSHRLAEAIEARFGFAVPVVVRTASALQALGDRHPLDTGGLEPKLLHVGFMSGSPTRALDAEPPTEPGDAVRVQGEDLLLRVPGGLARTRLTVGWFERQLGVQTITVRNWRTVGKVVALLG